MKIYYGIVLLFFVHFPLAQAGGEAVIVRLAPVHSEASTVSTRIGQISAGSIVSVFERQGGWKQIYSEEKSILGWVRGYQVRESRNVSTVKVKPKADSRGFLSGLASLSRKASGFFKSDNTSTSTSSGTATIGVRGLSEEEIKSAKPDLVEFEKFKGFASNKPRMPDFASQGGLRAKRLKHLTRKKD
jgi:hypothetical protein